MQISTQIIDYYDGDTRLKGFFAFDSGFEGRRPGILIAPTWAGRGEFVEDKAVALAELGYAALALDIYGEGKCAADPEECAALMQPYRQDRALLKGRILAGLEAIKRQAAVDAGKLAAIGYCFGGLTVLDLARTGVAIAGVVSFHGILDAPDIETAERIPAKVLVLHGDRDPLVPSDQLLDFTREMTAKEADWQLHMYGGAMHSFTNPAASLPDAGFAYNAKADRRSWDLMKTFLEECFEKAGTT